MKYKKIYRPVLLLLLTGFLCSCIDDNLSGCRESVDRVLLGFYASPADGNDMKCSEISSLDVFVFDAQGNYHSYYRDADPRSSDASYRLALPLSAGSYRFVVWANTDASDYTFDPDPSGAPVCGLSDARLSFVRPANDTVSHTIGHLFEGYTPVTEITAGDQEVLVPMEQDTYTIHVEIAGLSSTAGACRAIITDDHDSYDFYNLCQPSPYLHYTGSCAGGGSDQQTSLRVLRLRPESTTRLKVYSAAGTSMYDASLIDLISAAAKASGSSMDLDRIHTYTVRLEQDKTHGKFTVTVNGWDALDENQNIHPQS